MCAWISLGETEVEGLGGGSWAPALRLAEGAEHSPHGGQKGLHCKVGLYR